MASEVVGQARPNWSSSFMTCRKTLTKSIKGSLIIMDFAKAFDKYPTDD